MSDAGGDGAALALAAADGRAPATLDRWTLGAMASSPTRSPTSCTKAPAMAAPVSPFTARPPTFNTSYFNYDESTRWAGASSSSRPSPRRSAARRCWPGTARRASIAVGLLAFIGFVAVLGRGFRF